MRVLPLFLLLCLACLAQEAPEIRGTVIEFGPNAGIAGATITLTERVFKEPDIPVRLIATAVTDARGQFSFKPGHYGDFYLEASMAGYSAPANLTAAVADMRVMAMSDEPRVVILTLLRPATLSGRFTDVNGKPIRGLVVATLPRQKEVVTDQDGVFVFRGVPPGSYVVHPLPATSTVTVMTTFSTADADAVDEDYDSSYWPGGTPDAKSALPVQVNPAVATDLGTIALRRVTYHRLRLSFGADCSAREKWAAMLLDASEVIPTQMLPFPCAREILLRNVRPGPYKLLLSATPQDSLHMLLNVKQWAMAHIVVTRNTHMPLTLAPPTLLTGRITLELGTVAATPADFSIAVRPTDIVSPFTPSARPDADGRFVLPDVAWSRHKVVVESQNQTGYVKEIRYNGQVFPDGALQLVPDGTLNVTVNDGAAILTGKVAGVTGRSQATVYLTKWPWGALPPLMPTPPFQHLGIVEADGTFWLPSLPPGEYRILAIPNSSLLSRLDETAFRTLLERTASITLERGVTTVMDLRLTEVKP